MKAIVPVVNQDEAVASFMAVNNNRRRVRRIVSTRFFHRPFWLARADYVGRCRFSRVEGTIVALADSRIFRLGILGVWKYRLPDHHDLTGHGVDFRVADARLDGRELEAPIQDGERVARELAGHAVRKTMSKGLAITGVELVNVDVMLVYRPYWEIVHVLGGGPENAFMSADAVLLNRK